MKKQISENKKRIPAKNYIILAIVVFLTICVVFYAKNWYITAKEYAADNSPLFGTISEINKNEISNYSLENPKFVLYVSAIDSNSIKRFEQKFRNYLINNNLTASTLYINALNYDEKELSDTLNTYLDSKVKTRISIKDNVSMYIFDDGKIVAVIKDANKLTTKKINQIFKKYGMIDND